VNSVGSARWLELANATIGRSSTPATKLLSSEAKNREAPEIYRGGPTDVGSRIGENVWPCRPTSKHGSRSGPGSTPPPPPC